MAEIRTVTDPQEKTLLMLDEVRAGNEATRKEIKRLQRMLKEGQLEADRLRSELMELTQRNTEKQ